MMDHVLFADNSAYNNILYIGDNARDCLKIIERFNARLSKIEQLHAGWFNQISDHHINRVRLQHYIQYHFEGGIAVFKFRNERELPDSVRNECLVACQSLAFEQLFLSTLPAYPLN